MPLRATPASAFAGPARRQTVSVAPTQPQTPEYEFKAELLARLAAFVEFPATAFADGSPFVIGVLGEDPFGPVLEQVTEGRNVAGREIIVRRFADLRDLSASAAPHILFVPASERPNYGALFNLLAEKPVLTVGEEPGFARDRGVVNLTIVDNRPRVEIANERAQALGLRISAQLLRMSNILRGPAVGR